MSKKKEIKHKSLSVWGFTVTSISLLFAIIIAIITLQQPKLEFAQHRSYPLLPNEEGIDGLSIFLDNKNIRELNQNISLFSFTVRNKKLKPILLSHFDEEVGYGFSISNGKIIQAPEISNSSDSTYFSDIIVDYEEDRILLGRKIIRRNESFDISFFILHEDSISPQIRSFGELAHQKEIEIVNILNDFKYSWKIIIWLLISSICFGLAANILRPLGHWFGLLLRRPFIGKKRFNKEVEEYVDSPGIELK